MCSANNMSFIKAHRSMFQNAALSQAFSAAVFSRCCAGQAAFCFALCLEACSVVMHLAVVEIWCLIKLETEACSVVMHLAGVEIW